MINFLKKNIDKILLIIFLILIYVPFILKGGIIYDDWSVLQLSQANPGVINSYSHYLSSFINRPIAPFILALTANLFKTHVVGYILSTLLFWITGVLIAGVVFKKIFGQLFFFFFIIFSTIPVFASTIIFSPAMQFLGSVSLFFWAISFLNLYQFLLQYKVKYAVLSVICIFISLLTYEVTAPLFIFSVILLFLVKRSTKDGQQKLFFRNYFLYVILPLVVAFCLIIIYQKFIARLIFFEDISRLRFRGFVIVPAVLSKFVAIILFDIPHLLMSSYQHIKQIGLFGISPIIIPFIYLGIVKNQNDTEVKNSNLIKYLFICLGVTFLSILLFYIAAATIPTIHGYYNRGLVSFSIIFAIFFAALFWWAFLNQNKLCIFILILFLFSYINSFVIQRDNYIQSWSTQNNIISDISMKMKKYGTNKILLANVPEFLPENFNDETVFSEEVGDLGLALSVLNNGSKYNVGTFTKHKIQYRKIEIIDGILKINDDQVGNLEELLFYEYDGENSTSTVQKIDNVKNFKNITEQILNSNINSISTEPDIWLEVISWYSRSINIPDIRGFEQQYREKWTR